MFDDNSRLKGYFLFMLLLWFCSWQLRISTGSSTDSFKTIVINFVTIWLYSIFILYLPLKNSKKFKEV